MRYCFEDSPHTLNSDFALAPSFPPFDWRAPKNCVCCAGWSSWGFENLASYAYSSQQKKFMFLFFIFQNRWILRSAERSSSPIMAPPVKWKSFHGTTALPLSLLSSTLRWIGWEITGSPAEWHKRNLKTTPTCSRENTNECLFMVGQELARVRFVRRLHMIGRKP